MSAQQRKLVSWNVNGLRAAYGKGFAEFFEETAPDVLCLQETKMQQEQSVWEFPGYHCYWNSAVKKGYSGTLLLAREEPIRIAFGMGIQEHDQEGRLITAEFPGFYLVNCYTPNAQRGLLRLDYRMGWEADFRAYLCALAEKQPVVLCGDLNVAHQAIDLKNPSSNHKNAGFTDEEREQFTKLLDCGFADVYRTLHPDEKDAYTWWSYMGNARARNVGWRIDYFVVSRVLLPGIASARIHPQVPGSDHCPVSIDLVIS